MKILHAVQFYHPAKGGMEEVVKQISERLVEMGHEVTVATSAHHARNEKIINGVKLVDFNIRGNNATGIRGETNSYISFLKNEHFDIITCFAAQQWSTDIILNELDNITGKKVFVPTGFSGLYMDQFQDYFKKMPAWMNKFDMNVFLSNDYRDINFAREHGITKNIIIANGASEIEFADNNNNCNHSDTKIILHVGNHTGQKGHRELFKLFSRANINNVHLFIIGEKKCKSPCYIKCLIQKTFSNLLFKLQGINKKIFIKDLSREELLKLYHRADLFLLPSNIECSPLVLFESMASQTAFLTSDVGNAIEIIQWSNGGKLMPTTKDSIGRSTINIDQSVIILEQIINNEEERSQLANDGHIAWKDKFTWQKIAQEYESLYFKLLQNC